MALRKKTWIVVAVLSSSCAFIFLDSDRVEMVNLIAEAFHNSLNYFLGKPELMWSGLTVIVASFGLVLLYQQTKTARKAAEKERAVYVEEQIMFATMLSAEISILGVFARRMVGDFTQGRIPQVMPDRRFFENQLSNFLLFPRPLMRKIVRFYSRLDLAEQDRVIAQERSSADGLTLGDLEHFRRYRDRMVGISYDATKIRHEMDRFFLKTYGWEAA